jgi:hypothetical protein
VTNLNLPSESESVMKHAQADYINAGYKYEKANSADKARAVAEGIRKMLEEEDIKDQADARHLVGRGRQEARETA